MALARRRWLEHRAILLIISIAATILALTLIEQANYRNIVVLTPQVAILIAIALTGTRACCAGSCTRRRSWSS